MNLSVGQNSLPWWTWIASFFFALLAKFLCIRFFYIDGFFYIYGSFVVCLPLYFMWGPRVFWGQLVAESLTGNIVGLKGFEVQVLHGAANSMKPFLGYYLYKMASGMKPKTRFDRSLLFFFWTLIVATLIGNLVLISFRVGAGDVGTHQFVLRVFKQTLRDCIWGYLISLQILEIVGPWLKTKNMSFWPMEETMGTTDSLGK